MEIAAIAGVVILATFLAVLLRQQRPEQAMAVSLLAGIGILALVLSRAVPVFQTLQQLLQTNALPAEYGTIVFKGLGICLLTQLAADTCRDAGENALAAKAELAGKLMMVMLALPLFEKLAELAASLIQGSGS